MSIWREKEYFSSFTAFQDHKLSFSRPTFWNIKNFLQEVKQKLVTNLRSPLDSGLSAGTSTENTASSPAENTSTLRPSPELAAQLIGVETIPHPSRWDDQWKKAAPSEMMPCQVASDPERKTCASKMSRAPWEPDAVRHPSWPQQ